MPVQTRILAAMLVLGIIYTMYFAASLLIPFAFAILLSMLLLPTVRFQKYKLGIPTAVGAAFSTILFIAAIGGLVALLTEPATEWISKAPSSVRNLEEKLKDIREPVRRVQETTKDVEKLTNINQGEDELEVTVKRPSLLENTVSGAPIFIAGLGVMISMLYFLLATGDSLQERLTDTMRRRSNRIWALGTMREVQRGITHYLGTITGINVGLGVVVSLVLWTLDVPNPLLWGALAGLLNFAPYVGAAVSFGLITLVSLMTFDSAFQAMMPPLAFLMITTLEGLLITPMILGRGLSINPLLVFLSIVIWGWIWGVAGALMAVPILVSAKIVLERIPRFSSYARVLGKGPFWQETDYRKLAQEMDREADILGQPETEKEKTKDQQ